MAADLGYAIIGGGVIGRAIAYALHRRGRHDVAVLEQCPRDRIVNQSTRNSGVIHAGIYYKHQIRPKKASMCVVGNRMLYEFCEEFAVHHARTGKLVVATCAREEEFLHDVHATALQNGVPGVALLTSEQVRAIEPRLATTLALHVPSSGVIDAAGYLDELRHRAQAHDLFETRVDGIRRVRDGFELHAKTQERAQTFVAGTVINAAGLYADEIARMIDPDSHYQLMPVRGEAARFRTTSRPELAMRGINVYPAPHGFYKDTGQLAEVSLREFEALLAAGRITDTVGVHLTPTLDGDGAISATMTISPAIRTGVARDDFRSEVPPDYYWDRVRSFFPALLPTDIELHDTGIQARLREELDWRIESSPHEPRFINLIGIDSPGLTASLAIADYVIDELLA